MKLDVLNTLCRLFMANTSINPKGGVSMWRFDRWFAICFR